MSRERWRYSRPEDCLRDGGDMRDRARGSATGAEIYIARQPIFDAFRQVHAYELLYRASSENRFMLTEGAVATSAVIARTFSTFGFENLTAGKVAFINFPRELIIDRTAEALPQDRVAIEILEDITPDEPLLDAIRHLRDRGYTVALDDFVLRGPEYQALLELADIVKVDWKSSSPEQREAIARGVGEQGPQLLAEKVETEAEFQAAVALGYRYFQGYFFARPEMVSAREVPGFKLNYLRLLKQIQTPSLDYDEIESIIKSEGALVHWVLKRVNSPAFGFRSRINSIRQALVAMGDRELRRWVSVFCIAGMGEDRPRELLVHSFVRACFCEEVARGSSASKLATEAFLVGMLSMLDTVLGRPLAGIVDELPLVPETRGALLEGFGSLGRVLSCVMAYEQGRWDSVSEAAGQLASTPAQVTESYLRALARAREVFGADLPSSTKTTPEPGADRA